jgi:outer membrane biosynthesis protein TonB
VLRLDLDRAGVVRNVAVIVGSADPSFDQQLVAQVGHDSYAPAKLGGRAIGSSVFREIRH